MEKRIWDTCNDYDGFDEDTFLLLRYCGKLKLVVEIGCGSGAWTTRLSEVAEEVIGIDFSSSLIKKAHRKLQNTNCNVILADAEFLPLKEKSVDQCIFTFSLHHISNTTQCLEDVSRCLKKNSSIILIEPNGSSFARFFAYRIRGFLRTAGDRTSKPIESLVNIHEVTRILSKSGFKTESRPSSATIAISDKSASLNKNLSSRMYIESLKIATLIFPGMFGSSDFFLVGKRES